MRPSFFSGVDDSVDYITARFYHRAMEMHSGKRVAMVKLTLTKRTVETPGARREVLDRLGDKLTGFGVCVQPSGTNSFIVKYRAGDGGRKAPNKRIVIERYGRIASDKARRLARIYSDASPRATILRKSITRHATCQHSNKPSRTTW